MVDIWSFECGIILLRFSVSICLMQSFFYGSRENVCFHTYWVHYRDSSPMGTNIIVFLEVNKEVAIMKHFT